MHLSSHFPFELEKKKTTRITFQSGGAEVGPARVRVGRGPCALDLGAPRGCRWSRSSERADAVQHRATLPAGAGRPLESKAIPDLFARCLLAGGSRHRAALP